MPHPARQQQAWCQDNEISGTSGTWRTRASSKLSFVQRLIALRQTTIRVPPPALPAGPRRGRSWGCRTRWWFRPDGRQDDPARLAVGHQGRRAVPERALIRLHRRVRGPGDRRRLVPAAVQRPARGRHVPAAGAPLRGALGAWRSDRPSPTLEPGSRDRGARASRSRCPHRSAMVLRRIESFSDGAARHVPPAAVARPGLPRRPRPRALPARPRRSRTCTCRRCCRPARARRTATTRSTPPGSPKRWAGRRRSGNWPPRAWGSCSTSCPTTWEPATRTAGGRTPRSSTSMPRPASIGGSSTSTTSPPCGWRSRRSSSCCTARCSALIAEGLVDGVRVDHPDGLADPAGYLERLRDCRPRPHLDREDPPSRRAHAGLARGRDRRV